MDAVTRDMTAAPASMYTRRGARGWVRLLTSTSQGIQDPKTMTEPTTIARASAARSVTVMPRMNRERIG
jgi:hypothetical protein